MKKILLFLSLIFLLFSCNYPMIQKQEGKFYYVTYIFKSGKFDDAIGIIKEIIKITKERGLNEFAIGRYPTGNEWQLGFIANGGFELKEIKGYTVNSFDIPSGNYASMIGIGHPENIFIYWDRFKKLLINDGYKVDSPVFEIYKLAFDEKTEPSKRIGEMRYHISKWST